MRKSFTIELFGFKILSFKWDNDKDFPKKLIRIKKPKEENKEIKQPSQQLYYGTIRPDLKELYKKEKVPKILVTCEGCGGKTYDTDINYCSDCGNPTCPNCDNYDIQEEKHYCNDCWSKKGSVK